MPNAAIVGSDPDHRMLLRGLLHLEHHQVVAEAEGREVLERLDAPGGTDLLVVTEDAAGGRWQELVTDARRGRPALKVVLITARRTDPLVKAASSAGIDSVLQRPFALRQFAEAVVPSPTRSGAYATGPARPTSDEER